jgi:anion transporter
MNTWIRNFIQIPDSVLALIILGVIIFFFVTRLIPLGLAAVLGSVAMAAFGLMSFAQVFAPFGSDIMMLLIGILTVGAALTETGGTKIVGEVVMKIPGIGKNERLSLIVILLVVAISTAFLFNTVVVATFLSVLSAAAKSSNGVITKKGTYMATGFAAVVGGNMTLVSSTPQIVAQGILMQTDGVEPMRFFTITAIALPLTVVLIIFYATIGYTLQKKKFNFDEVFNGDEDSASDKKTVDKKRAAFVGVVFMVCLVCFFMEVATLGTVAVLGASACIIAKCITIEKAVEKMDWTAVMVLGGALGFSVGLEQSGAMALIVDGVFNIVGDALTPRIALAVFIFLPLIIGNFFANTAVTILMVTLAIPIALELGVNPQIYAIAIVVGCSLTLATPVSTPPITMTLKGGYRFGDYTVMGGLLGIICGIVAFILIPIIYGL